MERDAESAEGVKSRLFLVKFLHGNGFPTESSTPYHQGKFISIVPTKESSFPCTKRPTQDSNFIKQITNKYFFCEQTEV